MVTPKKTYSDNAFVDNNIYYAKLMAMNCTIKDEEEALNNETKESLYAGDVLMACVENRASYEMFESFPREILEKYVSSTSNLDIYAKNVNNLKTRLNHYTTYERNKMLDKFSSLARTIYIDHYDIMADYIDKVGPNWLVDNLELYKKCKSGKATYEDLFDVLPMKTNIRIIRAYLNSHGYCDLVSIWEPELITAEILSQLAAEEAELNGKEVNPNTTIVLDTDYLKDRSQYNSTDSDFMNQFKIYIKSRTDQKINSELNKISKAMREVFISHYDTMRNRKYFNTDLYYKNTVGYTDVDMSDDESFRDIINNGTITSSTDENGNPYSYTTSDGKTYTVAVKDSAWLTYILDKSMYNKCVSGKATYEELYNYFGTEERQKVLVQALGEQDVNDYGLNSIDEGVLEVYFDKTDNAVSKKLLLSKLMRDNYIKNYNLYLNNDIYLKCKDDKLSFYDLYPYLPKETIKSIISTEIPETTNIQVYSEDRDMLDSYLNTLDKEVAQNIRDNITKDMIEWYPSHHVEKNNYYRALIGLPPIGSNDKPYEDTLTHTYDATSGSFIEFGNTYINQCPTDIYPQYHWNKEIYKFDSYDVSILDDHEVLQNYISYGCKSNMNNKRYRYMKYLGDEKLDLYTCRKAENFAIIGMPSVDNSDIYKKFIDTYNENRQYVIRAVYSDAYKFQSDYYNKFIIVFILVNTIMDLLGKIPDFIINRDVFDARCIKYLFEANGIPYYDEIPIKYQQAMLKNLNTLIKYKSSTKNMVDICSLFGFSDVKVFDYYLMKNRETDSYTGQYILDQKQQVDYDLDKIYVPDEAAGTIKDVSGRRFSKLTEYRYYDEEYYLNTVEILNDDGTAETKKIINNERDVYIYDKQVNEMIPLKDSDYFTKIKANTKPASLKFIRVPIDEALTDYKKDPDNIVDYDEITTEITWDGGLDHEYLKNKILDYEFNAVKSKYISIETTTNLTEMAFQTTYFFNMLFDNLYSEDLLTVSVPSISQNHKFRLADIIFYLFAITYYYHGLKDTIMYSPTQALYVKGYNFDDALNKIMQDERYFTQKDNNGYALQDYEKENIFDINERIDKNKYNYREIFNDPKYYQKGFNLEANIDELEKWLNEKWNMSLEDFVVSEDKEKYGQVITLMQFYSLNNSYYQKSIFNGDMIPTQFNNIIKYAYDYDLIKKIFKNDINKNPHTYLKESEIVSSADSMYDYVLNIVALVSKSKYLYTYDELMERLKTVKSIEELSNYAYILTNIFGVDDESQLKEIAKAIERPYYDEIINTTDDIIYVMDYDKYAHKADSDSKAIYHKYKKNNSGTYVLQSIQYYTRTGDNYSPLVSGDIYVQNSDKVYVGAYNKLYTHKNNAYTEITDDKYFITNPVDGNKILNLGNYYIMQDGKMILNPENCYIKVKENGQDKYILLKDLDNYITVVTDSDCYIHHDDGHFVRFDYTDYYIRTHKDVEGSNEMVYKEEDLFIISQDPTEYYDPSADPVVYYKKLDDYYKDNDYVSYKDTLYVKDPFGNYIPENQIISPTNCWYFDYDTNDYKLVMSYLYTFQNYEDPMNVIYIMILQSNYDYYKYALDGAGNYIFVEIPDKRYMVNSEDNYITVFDESKSYDDTDTLVVVMNRAIHSDIVTALGDDNSYNPSLHDNIWDENDWFYPDKSYDENNESGMNGENLWYYHKPGTDNNSGATPVKESIGSGWMIDSSEYIKDIKIESGKEYYMSFDILCNFDGTVQIYNQADPNVEDSSDRSYSVKMNEKQHINQIFIANGNETPSIMVLKYNFAENPINIGDMCVVSNVKFSKAYSDSFVANDIPDYDKLLKIYRTNEAIYKYLVTQMRETSDKDKYDIYKKLYDSLMVTKYNKEMFKIGENTYAKTYTDFLQSRDEILYNRLEYYKSLDEDAMKREISDEIIEITYALDGALNNKGDLDYLYSYFPAVSISYVQQYIYKVINWFKSWKVHLLGISTVYRLGSGVIVDSNGNVVAEYNGDEFMIHILHHRDSKIRIRENQKEGFVYGEVKVNPIDATNPAGIPYSDIFDFDYTNRYSDSIGLRDRVRIITRSGNKITYTGPNNEIMHINLEDNTTRVKVTDHNKLELITAENNTDEFHTKDTNNMIISTDKSPQAVEPSQFIDEINLLSGDYLGDYADLDDLEKEDDYEQF